MDRNDYLELCRKRSRKEDVKVRVRGIICYPLFYKLAFDNYGGVIHGCGLEECSNNRAYYEANLREVEAYEE